ncbi:MAG: hypothetical protein V4754_18920 [Pseudomonadota bacterium]
MGAANESEQLQHWLAGSPVDTILNLYEEQVFLNLARDGAELGLVLLPQCGADQLAEVMGLGFSSALQFEAGLSCSADGKQVSLTRYLPGVLNWVAAGAALQALLEQAAAWRIMLSSAAPAASKPAAPGHTVHGLRDAQRQQQRLLGLLQEKKS